MTHIYCGPPKDWRHRTGRPRQTWLTTVEDNLRPLKFSLATARQCTLGRWHWHGVNSWSLLGMLRREREMVGGSMTSFHLKPSDLYPEGGRHRHEY